MKRKIDWAKVEGAKDCKRRLHLEKNEDGLYPCPVPHCDHDGFLTRRGCRKHVRSKHSWYSYFDAKPSKLVRKSLQVCGLESEDKSASLAFYSALSNSLCALVGERFVEWLCGSTGGGKPKKQAQQTANRVLRYLRFCCADDGEELTEETIDFCLGSPSLVCRFVDAMQDELKLGHSAQLGYLNAISELTDYRKVSGLSVQVLSSFATTEVYMKRARKTIAKKMKIQWARDLDVDTLEARGSWASLEDLSKVIPYHLPRLNSVLECCKTEATSVTPADLTFATRFLATYLFVQVKGSRPMTYQHLTLEMVDKAQSNGGFIDQKMFKTAHTYSFDSLLLGRADLELIEQYRTHVRPLLKPKCDYLLVTRNGTQYSKLCDLLSKQVFEAIGKHIHPTRYRQIVETESASRLDANEQQAITEDQKHSSRVAKLHYQKRRSREIATRGHACMQKLRGESAAHEAKQCSDAKQHADSASDHRSCSSDDGHDGEDEEDDDNDDDPTDDHEYGKSNSNANDANNNPHANHNNNNNDSNNCDDDDEDNNNYDNDHSNDTSNDANHERRPAISLHKSDTCQLGYNRRLAGNSNCQRKTVLHFTVDEDRHLGRGLAVHGFGRWKNILDDPKLTFQRGRTADSIKKRAASLSFQQRYSAHRNEHSTS